MIGADGDTRESVVSPSLYNSALAVRLTSRLEACGTYAKGLEEAGVAPATAANRNEVLPPIAVTQREFGVRLTPSAGLSLVAAGFDTRKPYAGVDATTDLYRLLGTVKHRGFEASIAGRPITGLALVIGGVWLAPWLSGGEVSTGRVGTRPVGVPTFRAVASVDYAAPWVKGLSIDTAVASVGRRAASSAPLAGGNQLEVDPLASVNLGTRFSFRLIGTSFALRAQVQNVFDQFSWEVNSSETLNYSAPRRARVVLTADF